MDTGNVLSLLMALATIFVLSMWSIWDLSRTSKIVLGVTIIVLGAHAIFEALGV